MPLMKSKSDKAFKKNVETEMDAGKPQKQSLAIAFNTQKHAKKKPKMAEGGMVSPILKENYKDMSPADLMEDDERAESIAEAIMQKRRKFADGGMVDLEANSEEKPNEYDELNEMAADAEQYDDGQISPQPEDSNEMGDDLDSDKQDMISRIRSKLRMKSGA